MNTKDSKVIKSLETPLQKFLLREVDSGQRLITVENRVGLSYVHYDEMQARTASELFREMADSFNMQPPVDLGAEMRKAVEDFPVGCLVRPVSDPGHPIPAKVCGWTVVGKEVRLLFWQGTASTEKPSRYKKVEDK